MYSNQNPIVQPNIKLLTRILTVLQGPTIIIHQVSVKHEYRSQALIEDTMDSNPYLANPNLLLIIQDKCIET
jgi:hypothetical protein